MGSFLGYLALSLPGLCGCNNFIFIFSIKSNLGTFLPSYQGLVHAQRIQRTIRGVLVVRLILFVLLVCFFLFNIKCAGCVCV